MFAFIFFLLFGSGLIISPSYYPSSLESLLSVLPLAMVIKSMQSYLFSGFINWIFTVIPLLTGLLLLSLNSILIRNYTNPFAWKREIYNLSNNYTLRKFISKNSLATAARNSWEERFKKIYNLYQHNIKND